MGFQELIPDPAILITGLRDTGYDVNTALADVIDNSVDAGASIVEINIALRTNGQPLVTIADDGCGMNREELIDGMKYGSSSTRAKPASRLGKFGLGLKTASTAFCRKLSVISKSKESEPYYMATWDLDVVAKSNRWELEIKEAAEIPSFLINRLESVAKGKSGTLVVWDKIDRFSTDARGLTKSALDRIVNRFEQYATMVYHRFLDTNYTLARNITMRLNGKSLVPFDPFCLSEIRENDETGTLLYSESDKNCSVVLENGDVKESKFHLAAYIIPNKDDFSSEQAMKAARITNSNMGFYVYRENRMIAAGDWLDLRKSDPHDSLCRIEFSFDHTLDAAFKIDVKKSRIILNPDLADWISNWMKPAVVYADQRYRKKILTNVVAGAATYHRGSNKNIERHESEAQCANISVSEEPIRSDGTKKVYVENSTTMGVPFSVRVTIPNDDIEGVSILVDPNVPDGLLWAPTIRNNHHAVLLNPKSSLLPKDIRP